MKATFGEFMGRRVLQSKFSVLRLSAAVGLSVLAGLPGAFAQSGSDHPQDQKPQAANPADAKENQRKADEFGEAAQALREKIGRDAWGSRWRSPVPRYSWPRTSPAAGMARRTWWIAAYAT